MVFMWFLNYEWSWRVILEIVCIWLSINLFVSALKGWMTPCNLDFLLWIYLQWALSIPIFHFIIRDHFIFWRIVVLLNYKNIVCASEMIPQVKAVEQVIITEYSIMYHVVNWKYWTLWMPNRLTWESLENSPLPFHKYHRVYLMHSIQAAYVISHIYPSWRIIWNQ